jgi:dihydrolipoamide dehydrogenase
MPLLFKLKMQKEKHNLEGDYALVSVGRRPYTDGLNADKAGVKISDRVQVEVNDHLQTNVPTFYAIGDVARYHKAKKKEQWLQN